jgi:hypothetical protein
MKRCIFAVFAVAALSARISQASLIILGNLPPTDDASFNLVDAGIDNVATNFLHIREAVSFTMPAQSYPIDHVALRLDGYNTIAGDVAAVGFYLDDGADMPGALVGSLLNHPSSSNDDVGQFDFTPVGTLTLSASTRYWLLVDATAGEYEWRASSPPITPTSQVGAVFGKQLFLQGNTAQNSTRYSSFEIVSSIPEPLANVLLATAFVGIGMLCRTCQNVPSDEQLRNARSRDM